MSLIFRLKLSRLNYFNADRDLLRCEHTCRHIAAAWWTFLTLGAGARAGKTQSGLGALHCLVEKVHYTFEGIHEAEIRKIDISYLLCQINLFIILI